MLLTIRNNVFIYFFVYCFLTDCYLSPYVRHFSIEGDGQFLLARGRERLAEAASDTFRV